MATDSFRRHTRSCVDSALHRLFAALRHHGPFFSRLVRVVQTRSDLMRHAPLAPNDFQQLRVLQNLTRFEHSRVHEPETWAGATGHPLVVVDSLARHLFGEYPTPRFLASAWFGEDCHERIRRCSWFVAHARGQRFRSLALPIALTKRMEHVFLHTPDHFTIDHALRRAEIIGLGGSPELADVLLATRLGESFLDGERWREILTWLVARESTIDFTQLRPLVDFLEANIDTVQVRGRTFASIMRLVTDWHGWLGLAAVRHFAWPRSRWQTFLLATEPTEREPHGAQWTIVELLDSRELAHEGRMMRHCVASYALACQSRRSSIWSLRYRPRDGSAWRSYLTIEVRPAQASIVQVRGKLNSRARGKPFELVCRWAAREGLHWHRSVELADGARGVAA